MKPEIYKVQVPLASNEVPPLALVYNEKRNHEGLFPVTDDLLKIMKGRHKAFFHGQMQPDGKILFGQEAKWQHW